MGGGEPIILPVVFLRIRRAYYVLTRYEYRIEHWIYGALATSHKGKSRVDAEADFDRLFICIGGVECGVM